MRDDYEHCEHCEKFCVCKTCTCGKHKCPPQRDESIPFDGETTYHTHFPRRDYIATTSSKMTPKPWQANRKGEYSTEFKAQYVPKKATLTERSTVLVNTYQPSSDLRDWATAHSDDYIKWDTPRVQANKPSYERLKERPFDGSTEYTRNYTKKSSYFRAKRPVSELAPPSTFYGETSHIADYQRWAVERTKSLRPRQVHKDVADDRDFVSEFNNQYVKKQTSPCPITIVLNQDECTPVVKQNGHTYYVKGQQPRRPNSASASQSRRIRPNSRMRPKSAAEGVAPSANGYARKPRPPSSRSNRPRKRGGAHTKSSISFAPEACSHAAGWCI
jgi:hypothetical protein